LSSTGPPLPVAGASAPALDTSHARTVLAIGSLGFFLITLDISIVNVALPNITRDLGGGTSGQQWTIDGYTLLFAALLLFAGNLADRIGAKKALGLGIAAFTLASAPARPHRASGCSSPLVVSRAPAPRSCYQRRWP
jgi:DHA2 family methylenomycin A resistance protein-like MFS transporter